MNESSRPLVAMAVCTVAICGTVIWQGTKTRAALASLDAFARLAPQTLDEPASTPKEPPPVPSAAVEPSLDTPPPQPPDPAGPERAHPRLAQDSFAKVWRSRLKATAERQCWAPVEAKYGAVPPAAPLVAETAADGSLHKLQPDAGAIRRMTRSSPDRPANQALLPLAACLATLGDSLQFDATTGPKSVRVQVARYR